MDFDLNDSSREIDFDLRGDDPRLQPPTRRSGKAGALIVLAVLVGALAVFFYWRPLPFSTEPASGAGAPARGSRRRADRVRPRSGNRRERRVRACARPPALVAARAHYVAGTRQSRPDVRRERGQDGNRLESRARDEGVGAVGQVPDGRRRQHADHRPASYERYNTLANVVDSVDVEGAARAYRRLRPLLQQAFDELGYTNLAFDERLALALGRLVDTPIPEGRSRCARRQ